MLTALVCTWLRRPVEASGVAMSDFNQAVIAYLIYDYDKTLTQEEVMAFAQKMVLAADEFQIGLKEALEYVANNPDFGS